MKNTLIAAFYFILCGVQAQKMETVLQKGHYASVKSVAFTPNGKYLITGSRDKSAKLWDLTSGRELRSFTGHHSTINDIAVTKNGKFFITSGADRVAKLWEIKTGKLVREFAGIENRLTSVALSPDDKLLVTAGYHWEAQLWDLETGELLKTFKVNPDQGLGYGVDAQFSPNGKKIAFGGDNRSVVIYDMESGELENESKRKNGSCGGCGTHIAYEDNGEFLYAAGNGGVVRKWNIQDTTYQIFYEHDDEYAALDISKSGNLLVATEDSLTVLDPETKKTLFHINTGNEKPITDAQFSPDEKMIALSSDDMTVKLFDARSGKLLRIIQGYLNNSDKGGLNYDANSRWDYYIKKYTDLKNDIRVSPNGKYLVKGKIGSVARLWELESGRVLTEFSGHEKAVLCMEFYAGGKQLITGGADGKAKLWDIESGEELRSFDGHREVIFSLALSSDGSKLATSSWDGQTKIWDITSGKLLETMRFELGSPYQAQFVNGDIYLMVAGLDKTLKLWEIDSKKEIRDFIGHTNIINAFDIDPNGQTMTSVSWDGKVKIWDIASGLQTNRWTDHRGPVYGVTYNNDGTLLATSGADGVIKLREVSNGKVRSELKGHTAAVTSIQFTKDSRYLVSATEDGTIKIWEVTTGKELISYYILDHDNWMVINKDGYFNGTQEAFKNIAFVNGMKSFDVDQFFDSFYEPDILQKTFSDGSQKKRINMLDKVNESPPPGVEFIAPKSGDKMTKSEVDVLVKVTDGGGGVDHMRITHNGKLVYNEEVKVKAGKSFVADHKVSLIPGTNVIEASAYSEGGIESVRQQVKVQSGGEVKSTLYLVAVGINEYQNGALNLNYAKADAEGFVNLISGHSKGLFDHVEVITLYDKEATREKILQRLTDLSNQVSPHDVLFFYYAGHGSMIDGNFYFVPTDNNRLYSEDKLKKSGIYAGVLQEKLKAISALKQVLIIDACQSGGGVELLAQRGASEEKALAQLSRSTGIHVLAAAGSEQFATEFTELGHGLFTHVLLEALSGKADGAPKDGKITIYELKSYLDDQVPEYSRKLKGKMQFPHTFSRGQDFPIVID